jgi:hypothetical protein
MICSVDDCWWSMPPTLPCRQRCPATRNSIAIGASRNDGSWQRPTSCAAKYQVGTSVGCQNVHGVGLVGRPAAALVPIRVVDETEGVYAEAPRLRLITRNRFASHVLDGSDGTLSAPTARVRAARIGTEESIELRWKRGGFVRVVLVRIKYDASTPARVAMPADASASPATGDPIAPVVSGVPKACESAASTTSTDAGSREPAPIAEVSRRGEPACTPEELSALVASDRRTAGAMIVTAPMPPRLIERSFATPPLIAHVASDKFCDGLPLHRQEDRFARLGVPIDRATMCRWCQRAGAWIA